MTDLENVKEAFRLLNESAPDFSKAEKLLNSAYAIKNSQGIFFHGICGIINETNSFEVAYEELRSNNSCLYPYLMFLKLDSEGVYRPELLNKARLLGHLVSGIEYLRWKSSNNVFLYTYFYIMQLKYKYELIRFSHTRKDRYIHDFEFVSTYKGNVSNQPTAE